MLELRNLTKIYKTKGAKDTLALDSVSLQFPETGMVFLLGKSGSGKSTLLNVAGGLDTPTSGEIIIKGRSSLTFTGSDFDSYRNTFVGFIFQEYNILDEFSVEDNIALALELQGKEKDTELINALLRDIDLEEFAKRKPNTLSGGQKQRIAIARALVKDPKIIFADEPSGALDSTTGKQVFDTLKKLSKDKLVIVVSHDREFAETYGDRIIELKDGRVIADVTKEKIASKEEGNITKLSESTLIIKKGSLLSSAELKQINEFLASNNNDIILSKDEEDVAKFKKQARISSTNDKERFATTDPTKIEIKTYSSDEQKLIKSRFSLKNALKMGLSNLKLKPFRLIMTIWLSCTALTELGIVSTTMFYNEVEVAAQSMKDSTNPYINFGHEKQITMQYEGEDPFNTSREALFNDEDLTDLRKKAGKNDAEIIPVYNFSYLDSSSYLTNSGRFSMVNTECYDYSYEYYSTTLMGFASVSSDNSLIKKDHITGTYPTNNSEIMISSFTADSMLNMELSDYLTGEKLKLNKRDDVIGKKIILEKESSTITLTVSGIFDVDDYINPTHKALIEKDESDDYSFISLYSWIEERDSNIYTIGLVSDDFYSVHAIDFHCSEFEKTFMRYAGQTLYGTDIGDTVFNYIVGFENFKQYLYDFDGNSITSSTENSVYLSSGDFATFVGEFINGSDCKLEENEKQLFIDQIEIIKNEIDEKGILANIQTEKDAVKELNRLINQFSLSNILETELNSYSLDRDVVVKGVFYYNGYDILCSSQNNVIDFSYTWGIEANYTTKYVDDDDAIYSSALLSNSGMGNSDLKKLYKLHDVADENDSILVIKNPVLSEISYMTDIVNILSKVFLISGIVIAIFATLLLGNFITISITNKKREIGILRAVGAKGADVFKIFFSESLTIVGICFVVSCILTSLGCWIINMKLVEAIRMSILVFGVPSALLLIGISGLVAFFSTFLPVNKIARKKPVESIRSL